MALREQVARLVRVNVPSRIAKHSVRSVNVGISTFVIPLPPLFFFFSTWLTILSQPVRHVKALESRSQLLDAALASADEANRRWEECRALVDQLRIENAALRAALSQAQMLGPSDENKPVREGMKSGDEPKE